MNAQTETTTTPTLAPLLVDRPTAAKALAVSVATLDRLIRAGRIHAISTSPETTRMARRHGVLVPVRNAGAVRVSVESLKAFIAGGSAVEASK